MGLLDAITIKTLGLAYQLSNYFRLAIIQEEDKGFGISIIHEIWVWNSYCTAILFNNDRDIRSMVGLVVLVVVCGTNGLYQNFEEACLIEERHLMFKAGYEHCLECNAMLDLKILLLFYRNFWVASLLVSCIGGLLIWQSSSLSYAGLFSLLKILSDFVIGIFFHVFGKNQLYFYNNLSWSTLSLYSKTMHLDLAIWFGILG